MKKKNKLIILLVVLIAIAIVLLKIDFSNNNESVTEIETKNTKQIYVNTVLIKPKPLKNIIYSNGTLISNEEVEIRSEISGKITKIEFEEGRRVKRNELLVKINDAELQATLKKNLSKETLARDKEYRYKQLLEKSLSSQQEYDVVLSELNSVLADVEYIRAQIAKTEIRAPFDGIIGLRSVSVGSYISPDTKIVTLQSINPIKVNFSVPQKYFSLIKEGKSIFIKLPNLTKLFNGKIYAVEPKIDQNTRTVKARAYVPNEKSELTPGAYVEIEIILEEFNNAIMVPTDVIVPDIEGEKIYLYKNGFAVPMIVKTGIRTEDEIQVTSGLNVGDTIIVSGIIQLRPNANVELISVN